MKTILKTALLSATALSLVVALPAMPAYAQTSDEDTLEDDDIIVVTARKIAEDINDAPVAVTAFTSETIEDRGLTDISDIGAQTPGLSFSSAFGRDTDRPVIRGLGNVLAGVQFGVESGTAVFVDGALYSGQVQSLNFDSIERIEVVKGPQSALYGRNTYAGAINFITKTPGNEFTGQLSGRVAQYGEYNIAGSVNIPIVPDGLAARVDGRYYTYGGQYVNSLTNNKVGQEESVNVAATLYATPGENVTWRTRVAWERQDDGTPALFLQGAGDNNCRPGLRSAAFRGAFRFLPGWPATLTSDNENQYFCGVIRPGTVALNNEPITLPEGHPFAGRTIDGTATDGYYKNRWFVTSRLDVDIAGSGWNATAIFAYRNELDRVGTDSDHSDALVFFGPIGVGEPFFANTHVARRKDYSIEVKLSSPQDRRLRFSLGGYFYDYSDRDRDITFSSGLEGVPYGGDGSDIETTRNSSAFGQIEYDITDTVTIGVEGRYLVERKTSRDFTATGSDFFEGGTIKDFIPRVTLDWKPNDDTLVYAIYAEGNKPGGTNGSAGVTANIPSYSSEILRGGEIGLKQSLLDRRVQINLSVFYNKITNVQLTTAIPDEGGDGALTSVASNQGDAEVYGFEASLRARLAEPLTFNLGVAWNSAKFTRGCDEFEYTLNSGGFLISSTTEPTATEAPLCSIAGHRLPLGSEWQANGALDYRNDIGGDFELFANLNATYESSKFVQVHNLAETGDTFLVNARVGFGKGNWEIAAFVRNLTNEDTIPLATRWLDLRYGIASGSAAYRAAVAADMAGRAGADGIPRAFFGALRKGRTFGGEIRFRF